MENRNNQENLETKNSECTNTEANFDSTPSDGLENQKVETSTPTNAPSDLSSETLVVSGNGFSYTLNQARPVKTNKKYFGKFSKGQIIFLGILLATFVVGGLFYFFGSSGDGLPNKDYVAVLEIKGTIQSDYSYGNSYNQEFLLDTIDDLIDDDHNKGLLLYINSPGGEVYAGDELYIKLKSYKEQTGRPIYSYFANQATSCGYYIAALSDEIIANRNCITGSIGVKVGTFVDVSELLENYGVKAFDIDTGKFKSMGSSFREMSPEERAIWQAYIDEAYMQFVDVVAEGRNLNRDYVLKIADGRIYTAKQALKLHLIDGIGDFDATISEMENNEGLSDCTFVTLTFTDDEISLFDILTTFSANIKSTDALVPQVDRSAYFIADEFIPLYE